MLLNRMLEPSDIILLMVTYVMACFGVHVYSTRMFVYLRKEHAEIEGAPHKWKYYLRALPYCLWIYILMCPMFSITGLTMDYLSSLNSDSKVVMVAVCAGILAFVIVAIYLLAALLYAFFSCMVNDKQASFAKDFRIGLRNSGKIVGLALLAALISTVLTIIPTLLLFVCQTAYLSSIEANVSFGDNVLIPASGYVLVFIVAVFAFAIASIVSVGVVASHLYQYGSIKARVDAKENNSAVNASVTKD